MYMCVNLSYQKKKMALHNLSVVSYNSQGLGPGRIEYIDSLCKTNDFVCIQEHWLLPTHTDALCVSLPAINAHVVSGIEGDKLIKGRPYGGCAIIWKRNMMCKVEPIVCKSKRLCIVLVTMQDLCFVVCCVYMPCDNTDDMLYNGILNELHEKCIQLNVDNIIISGDFNTSMLRMNSNNTGSLNDFMHSYSFVNGMCKCPSAVDYTYESKMNSHKSVIDHIIMSENLYNFMNNYTVSHSVDNLSDHAPITATWTIPVVYMPNNKPDNCDTKINWKKASDIDITRYKQRLEESLSEIIVPHDAIKCKDLACTKHYYELHTFYKCIIDVCIKTGYECIPLNKSTAHKSFPGWNDKIKEPRQTAILWHSIWKSCGSPRNGTVADIRRRTRAQYHYAIRQLKHDEKGISAAKMADSLAGHKSEVFWKEVSKCNMKSKSLPGMVENVTDQDEICNVFAAKYCKLYNSVAYDKDDMYDLVMHVNSNIHSLCMNDKCHSSHEISSADVQRAVHRLKLHKHDGDYAIFSNNLIYGSPTLYMYLSLILSSMMRHGYVPDEMLLSTLIPIPKDKRKSLNNADNYRSIALGSIICKVYDNIILDKEKKCLKSTELQFGFKEGFSTTQCTFVVEETINYYKQHDSNVYTVLLDASKAFDKINYVKLFNLLVNRGMCPVTIRHILNMYVNQKLCVKWCDTNNAYFNITNGVKQGGILSPVLFTVYMDELLNRLKSCGYGCYVGNVFAGAVAYADDLTLMAPTKFSIDCMLKICSEYAREYDVTFNAQKSQLIYYDCNASDTCNVSNVKLDNNVIHVFKEVKHLGTMIGHLKNEQRVNIVVKDLYRRVNHVINQFRHAHHKTKYLLFKSYCMSLYSYVLLNVDDKHYQQLLIAWRKSIRLLFNLHPQTRSHLLPGICDDKPIESQLFHRLAKFIDSLNNCQSNIVYTCFKLALHGSGSNTCTNIYVLCNYYNYDKHHNYSMYQNKYNHVTATSNELIDI